MKSGIYKIEHQKTGRIYIGSSVNIKNRLCTHRNKLRTKIHHNTMLQNIFNKEGENAFTFSPLLICANEHLLMYEQLIMDGYKSYDKANGFNIRTKAESNYIHGMSERIEHKAWLAMIGRCNNPKDDSYKSCGGKGIKVCKRWLENFDNFITDMGNRPDNYTLSRKDTNKDFTLENCEWTDLKTRRTRSSQVIYVTVENERLSIADAARKLGISTSSIYRRMKKNKQSHQQIIDYLINKPSPIKLVNLNGENVNCAEAEKRLGIYQGAINCRRRRNKESYQQALDYFVNGTPNRCIKFVMVNGKKLSIRESARIIGFHPGSIGRKVKLENITYQEAIDHFVNKGSPQ